MIPAAAIKACKKRLRCLGAGQSSSRYAEPLAFPCARKIRNYGGKDYLQ